MITVTLLTQIPLNTHSSTPLQPIRAAVSALNQIIKLNEEMNEELGLI